jgi:hypothetical protein
MGYDKPYEPKPNTGSLFKNTFKKDGDKQPNLRGDIHLDKTFLINMMDQSKGPLVKLSISAWSGESPKVGKFLTLNVGEPYVKPSQDDDLPY